LNSRRLVPCLARVSNVLIRVSTSFLLNASCFSKYLEHVFHVFWISSSFEWAIQQPWIDYGFIFTWPAAYTAYGSDASGFYLGLLARHIVGWIFQLQINSHKFVNWEDHELDLSGLEQEQFHLHNCCNSDHIKTMIQRHHLWWSHEQSLQSLSKYSSLKMTKFYMAWKNMSVVEKHNSAPSEPDLIWRKLQQKPRYKRPLGSSWRLLCSWRMAMECCMPTFDVWSIAH
jgi:hypothetical protein